ncbi:predicted protein [Naegleria gruberi]|uniref:Predicted protein n=1 Tax=Naegleria gruberi TaxID=5762 RepID=D2V609_NAEGR|nr:uncharacterized protein NAEGRDRAFT_64270 [Naegleria gruberi]EFC47741.1 predicted protein [Naegleria gruberi]|eukprot:XP_002680485.1 predicted protein [Naegleria gruberi strain NEG-M]
MATTESTLSSTEKCCCGGDDSSSMSTSSTPSNSISTIVEPHMVEYNSLTGCKELFSTNPKVVVPGAIYIKNYISEEEEERIMKLIDSKAWCHEICRRTQMYGYTYYHTRHNLPTMQPVNESSSNYQHLDLKEFDWLIERLVERDGLYKTDYGNPTQCLVNEYIGTQGISSHVDNPGPFGDIITLVSLNKPIYMVLKLASNENIQTKILLEPRSLFVMKDDSRFKWKHGITHMKQVYVPSTGETLIRDENYRRVSLTFRFIKTDGTKKVTNEDPNADALW